jgi:hypothetical protein
LLRFKTVSRLTSSFVSASVSAVCAEFARDERRRQPRAEGWKRRVGASVRRSGEKGSVVETEPQKKR